MNRKKIGIFDSGLGGLTVMKAIAQVLPNEDIVYLGDTARLPYGTKSPETIIRYSIENTHFLIEQGIKALVVACHTACAFALETLQQNFDFPIVGVIQPMVDFLQKNYDKKRVAILGTRGTITSGIYQQNLSSIDLIPIQCQLLVHLAEEGYVDHPSTRLVLEEYLAPLQQHPVDAIVLGCTHFPVLRTEIAKVVNSKTAILDPAIYCAKSLLSLLQNRHLLNEKTDSPASVFFVSEEAEKFQSLAPLFLGRSVDHVKLS